MNSVEFESLRKTEHVPVTISGEQIADKTPRTLIYGYTVERKSFHVYLSATSELVRVIYDGDNVLISRLQGVLEMADCVPDKRVYPERCDFAFCQTLIQAGVPVPFTTFNPAVESVGYSGKVLEELATVDLSVFAISYPVTVSELSVKLESALSPYELSTVEAEVRERVNSQLQGYLRDRLLRQRPHDESKRWLDNIASTLEHLFTTRYDFMSTGTTQYDLLSTGLAAGISQVTEKVTLFGLAAVTRIEASGCINFPAQVVASK